GEGGHTSIRLLLAAVLLLVAVIPAGALADETSSPSEIPFALLQEAADPQNTVEAQLTDPQAAEELPHRDLGREEAVELTEAVFEPILASAAGPFQGLEVERYLSDNAAVTSTGAQSES